MIEVYPWGAMFGILVDESLSFIYFNATRDYCDYN